MQFTKMHGLGNDFVIIDNRNNQVQLSKSQIQTLAHRQLGIGFDQLLLIESSAHADFACQIYNADGSQAYQCGNGLRCLARYLHENKVHPEKSMTIETGAGYFRLIIIDYATIKLDLGIPRIINQTQPRNKNTFQFSMIELGNLHAIIYRKTITSTQIKHYISRIQNYYPNQAINFGFAQYQDQHNISLRTIEHGVGETFACGSNAAAAAIAGINHGKLLSPVTINLAHGKLEVSWNKPNQSILLSGPAELVYQGCTL